MTNVGEQNQETDNRVSATHLDKGDLSNEYIYEQALLITEAAAKQNVILRLIGATAFINHCPKYNYLYDKLERELTDVDLMSYSKTPVDQLEKLFRDIGYEPIRALGWHSTTRDIFVNEKKLYVDIFRDVLSFCHPISFIGRLELDYPTIPLVDLLLEKLQIVMINEKDLFDVIILLLEHDFGDDKDPNVIDLKRIINLWTTDWGFNYTGFMNLRKAQAYIDGMRLLSSAEKKSVIDKIEFLIKQVETAPKTLRWKLRGKIGTKVRWYEEVESVER